jgi:fluoride ion exporter CrcB/FEX
MPAISDGLHVSVGAVLGALTRIALGRAFGPTAAGVVSDTSPLFTDLPANAVGCLLAGMFAPFKARAAEVHKSLPHALSTGYLGSLTSMCRPVERRRG